MTNCCHDFFDTIRNILKKSNWGSKMLLKNLYSKKFLEELSREIRKGYSNFSEDKFVNACLATEWEDLKLMERSDVIVQKLHDQFPNDFEQTAPILLSIGPKFTGLAATCLPNYVAKYGLNDWDVSMQVLKILTQYSSAEFAIRPFLVKYPKITNDLMLTWSEDSNADVRRLSSEGSRPRLPWGIRLNQYIKDPIPVMNILEKLIFDKSIYVQKSVANNLNDISKDNPEEVIKFAQRHWHQTERADWIITRGLRTLFKQGNPEVLRLLGYDNEVLEKLKEINFEMNKTKIKIGETSTLNYSFKNDDKLHLPVYIGYRVHYVRQNEKHSYKDFFVKKTDLKSKQLIAGSTEIKWKQLSTRKLYPGHHVIDLLVNTKVVASIGIELEKG